MKFDLAKIAHDNRKVEEEFFSGVLQMIKFQSKFLAENFDNLSTNEISKLLKDLGVYGDILARK